MSARLVGQAVIEEKLRQIVTFRGQKTQGMVTCTEWRKHGQSPQHRRGYSLKQRRSARSVTAMDAHVILKTIVAWLIACAFLVDRGAASDDEKARAVRAIHAGLRAPAREIASGVYRHDFEHVASDGATTSLMYVARHVKHLARLGDADVGLISVKCDGGGDVVEVSVANVSAPSSWTTASDDVNATILVGNETIRCDDAESGQILHRVVKNPVLVHEDVAEGRFVYTLRATGTHFSDAFDDFTLKFYRGKRDIASVKEDLRSASKAESASESAPSSDGSPSALSSSSSSSTTTETAHQRSLDDRGAARMEFRHSSRRE